MRIPVATGSEPLILTFTLQGTCPNCRIRVYDPMRPFTSFTDRLGALTGQPQDFYVRMPIVGEQVVADIYQEGTDPKADNPAIKLIKKDLLDLETFPTAYQSGDPLIKEGIEFIKEFSLRAGYLGAGPNGSVYLSDGGKFRIDYLDTIVDRALMVKDPKTGQMVKNPNYGRELSTPARISTDRGVIEVSKKYFQPIPVSQRAPILVHEISHFYINNDQNNEKEADENAKDISLGEGFSDGDVYAAFVNVFKNAPTQENIERQQELLKSITDFAAKYYKYH